MSTLFREEALAASRQRLAGDVVIAQPVSLSVLTIFVVALIGAVLVFVSVGSYARKETVIGFLAPDRGLAKIYPPRSGVVGDVQVAEGDAVRGGQALLTVLADRVSRVGSNVNENMLDALALQLAELDVKRSIAIEQTEADRRRLVGELAALESEQRAVAGQLRTQQELLEKLESNNRRIRKIVQRGFVSEDSYLAREEMLLTNRRELAALTQSMVAGKARIEATRLAIRQLPLEERRRLSGLASQRAALLLKQSELHGTGSLIVGAPIPGKIATLRAVTGDAADPGLPLLSILPEGASLEAHLLVPTRAIGFTKVGQGVRIMYDAFDYRKFGVHGGTITGISSSVFSPAELGGAVRVMEPSYRVTVELHTQTVEAFGQRFPLQAGMSVRADIVLEERSLLDWILAPLAGLKGRT